MTRPINDDVDAAVCAIVEWMRSIPPEWRENWGLNATSELADQIEGYAWMFGPIVSVPGGCVTTRAANTWPARCGFCSDEIADHFVRTQYGLFCSQGCARGVEP